MHSRSLRYRGARPWMALNVISNTLKSIRALIGSQCKSRKSGVMWQNLGALQTSLADAFKTLPSQTFFSHFGKQPPVAAAEAIPGWIGIPYPVQYIVQSRRWRKFQWLRSGTWTRANDEKNTENTIIPQSWSKYILLLHCSQWRSSNIHLCLNTRHMRTSHYLHKLSKDWTWHK